MYKAEVYIKGERLDLFDDENITVVSSVQNIEDISRTFNDYSQSFTVPASPNNNRIFKHWYNFSIDNGFDARVRHKAHLDIQSMNFKQGTIRLESCEIENNKPSNYKLTFFGQLIELKSVISDDYLSALDLTAYDVDYTPENVKEGLVNGLSSGDYIFPLIGTKRQWFYNSSIASITYEERLSNIAWNASAETHGIEWTSLRPALLVNRIIEAIESDYSITFSRDFLFSAPFNNLYLWLANQDSEESLKSKFRVTDYNPFVNFPGNPTGAFQPAIGSFNNDTGSYSVTQNGASKLRRVEIRVDSNDGVLYTVQLMNGDNVLAENSGNGDVDIDHDLPSGVDQGSSLYVRIVTTTDKNIESLNIRIKELSEDTVLFAIKDAFLVQGSTARINEFLPQIRVLDFLKSLIKMYNLVVVPTSETDFYIETLDEWYKDGQTYDISAYVDTNKITVNRSTIFKEISFSFQEPQTILAEQFAKTNSTPYGDLETKLKNADGTALDGEEFEIEVDFEQMIYEKLFNLNDDTPTNIVYGLSLDNGLSETTPEAHLFYGIKRSISLNPLAFVDDTNTKTQINTTVYMPSHADSNANNYSTCFGGEVNEHTGAFNNNSLYKLYYDDYITDSFSIKRRKLDVTTRLPLYLLNKLKLNDKLIINSDRYIINQMTVNITTQLVNFELLNDIYGEKSDIIVQEEVPPSATPTPKPIPKAGSFSISSTGGSTSNLGCALTPNTTKYWNGTEPAPTLGDTIYNNQALTIKFNGNNLYYKIADSKALRITSEGQVTDVFVCGSGGGGVSQ